MSAYMGALSGTDYRLSIARTVHGTGRSGIRGERYRFARLNGWHCGHWHDSPEQALGCAIAKGAPMV